MVTDDSTEELRRKKQEARQSGGPERVAARREEGVGTARERVQRLLDPDTFIELDVFVRGAVTGHGRIGGRDVYVFSQDGEISPDVLGEGYVRKIVKVMDLAAKNGAPLVGIYDSGRLFGRSEGRDADEEDGEPITSLGGQSQVFLRGALLSGVVPQVAAVMGSCVGAAVFSPALADLIVMLKGGGHLFLGEPRTLRNVTEEDTGLEQIGGARTLSETSGLVHIAADDEAECLDTVRELLSYLPQNNLEETPLTWTEDPVDRMDEELDSLGRFEAGDPPDVHEIITRVVDDGRFTEIMARWAKNLVTGFGCLAGRAVGVLANQPAHLEGRLDQDAAIKAARFVRLCDAFNLPVVTFVDTPGFVPGEEQGHGRLVREAAKLMYAYCEATVPKISVVTHRAYAEGYEVMGSKHTGSDFNFAWPAAQIAATASEGSLDHQDSASPYEAAQRGHLDDVIEPTVTRSRIIDALEACASKREDRLQRKHGNIPL
jgi:acetyl-CoA carboxylase carboxyltransferase component